MAEGVATNGVNLTKIESYMVDGTFSAAQFHVYAEGHPEDRSMRLALEFRIPGTCAVHPYRAAVREPASD